MLNETRYEGIPANKKEGLTLKLELRRTKEGDKFMIKENSWNQMLLEPEDLILQDFLVPTVKGTLIRCLYFIEIIFTHAGITMGNEIPKIVFPIYMMVPDIKLDLHKMAAPLEYYPKALPKKDIKPQF